MEVERQCHAYACVLVCEGRDCPGRLTRFPEPCSLALRWCPTLPTPTTTPDVRNLLFALFGVVLFVTGVIVGVTYFHVNDGGANGGMGEPWRAKTIGVVPPPVLTPDAIVPVPPPQRVDGARGLRGAAAASGPGDPSALLTQGWESTGGGVASPYDPYPVAAWPVRARAVSLHC